MKEFKPNPYQREVIDAGPGLFCVTGNPGAGKTGSMVERIVRLVKDGLDPGYILAMTFTVKAADEMNKRLDALGVSGARVGTIHSVCNQIVRQEIPDVNRLKLSTGGMWQEIETKKIIQNFQRQRRISRDIDFDKVLRFLSACKSRRVCFVQGNPFGSNEVALEDTMLEAKRWETITGVHASLLRQICLGLEKARSLASKWDFDDMLLYAWLTLITSPDVRARWRNRWALVLVDEAQDSNPLQVDLSGMLVGLQTCVEGARALEGAPSSDDENSHNLMMLGDVSQSIYGFRGAEPEMMIRFSKREDVKVLRLPINYRSVPLICKVGSAIVKGKDWHLGGDMEPVREVGEVKVPVKVQGCSDPIAEISYILDKAEENKKATGKWASSAMLARLSVYLYVAEIECARRQIPYELRASGGFFESRDVESILAYLRVALTLDPTWKYERLAINRPFRFIGGPALDRAQDAVMNREMQTGSHGTMAASLMYDDKLSRRQQGTMARLDDLIKALKFKATAGKMKPHEVLEWLLQETKYTERMREENTTQQADSNRFFIVRALVSIASRFETCRKLIEYVDQVIDSMKAARSRYKVTDASKKDALVLSTIHRCVHPSTLIETENGLGPIGYLPNIPAPTGSMVATDSGMQNWSRSFGYGEGPLITVYTEGGYSLTMTPEHGIMSWTGEKYEEVKAAQLEKGMWLRLRIPQTMKEAQAFIGPKQPRVLPTLPKGDIRASNWNVPVACDEKTAEFFGMMAADGTLYKAGFRFVKRHITSVERFAYLCKEIFGCSIEVRPRQDCKAFYAEVNSTRLAAWLTSIGGMSPNNKQVPLPVRQSPLHIRTAFIRGLYEDATVNVKGDGNLIDHIAFTNVGETLTKDVQTMLLQHGITSRRFLVKSKGKSPKAKDVWRVDVSGLQALLFKDRIGFGCQVKQQQLMEGNYRRLDNMRSAPISKEEAKGINQKSSRQNAIYRGHLSRYKVEQQTHLQDKLKHHHVRIKSLRPDVGPSVCLEVPIHGRFLQNGFDACNSKGLEFPHVYIGDVNMDSLPCGKASDRDEELRLFYVALTRAEDTCTIVHSAPRDSEKSMFIFLAENIIRGLARKVTKS